jgi:hypothetical protein
MRVLANAGDAQRQLDDITAKAGELEANAIKMRFRLDDAEGRAQLDAIKARADELGFKDVNVKVRVDGAGRAIAELAAVKHEADTAGRGLIARIGGGIGGAISAFPSLGPIPGGPAGLGIIAAGLVALLPEVVAVANGFIAAGAGAAAFAALALPAVKSVSTAYQALGTAQQNYAAAQAKYAEAPTKSNATALANARLQLDLTRDSVAKLPHAEQAAIKGISSITAEFGKMARAFQPQVFKIFADGLQVLNNLMPHLTQFAAPFATALDGLLRKLGQFTQSSGFGQWMSQFAALIGPATTAIGEGIGKVAIAFGKLLTVFSGRDVAHGLSIAFGAISGVVSGVRVAIQALKIAWDGLSSSPTMKRLVSDFQTAWNSLSTIGKKKPDFSGLTAAVKDAVSTTVSWLGAKFGPLLHTALQSGATWLQAHAGTILYNVGISIMKGLISGLQSQIPSLLSVLGKIATFIAEHKGPIEQDRLLLVPHGQAIMGGLMAGIESARPALGAQLAAVTSDIGGYHAAMAGAAGGSITVNINTLQGGQEVARHVHQMLREYKRHGGGSALGLA